MAALGRIWPFATGPKRPKPATQGNKQLGIASAISPWQDAPTIFRTIGLHEKPIAGPYRQRAK